MRCLDRSLVPWSLVPDPWSLGCGPWSLVPGPWSLVPGPWSLVPSPWSLVPAAAIGNYGIEHVPATELGRESRFR